MSFDVVAKLTGRYILQVPARGLSFFLVFVM